LIFASCAPHPIRRLRRHLPRFAEKVEVHVWG
jgi:hypothetical protein